jgi:hypothetical protein
LSTGKEQRVSLWDVFMEERPEVVKAYQEMMKHVNKNNVLDNGTNLCWHSDERLTVDISPLWQQVKLWFKEHSSFQLG